MSQVDSGIRRLLALPAAYNLFQNLVGAPGARRRWIRECLKPFPGARILDIGCGTAELLDLLPLDVDYTGFDMSPAYIEAARRRYGSRGRFTCGTVEALGEYGKGQAAGRDDGHDKGYDIAMAFGVLHHLNDGEARGLFRAARKALKPGGRMVTLDCAFVPDQSRLARFFVARDRGRNVRDPDGYAALAREGFAGVETLVWRNPLRIPYTHAILVCRG
jgi:SAM-dependent methyltransferase